MNARIWTTYRGRPVFPARADWAAGAPQARCVYDLGRAQVGHGSSSVEPLAEWMGREWELRCDLPHAGARRLLERFFALVRGRQEGWWLPGEELLATAVEVHSPTEMDVRGYAAGGAGADVWMEHDGGARAALRISAATDLGGGVTRLEFDAEHGMPSAEATIRPLLYVRLAGDEVELESDGEDTGTATIRAMELPHEYAEAELGQRPVTGYHLWAEAPETEARADWRFTSHDVAVTIGGALYVPAPISHGRLKRSVLGDRDQAEVETWFSDGNPLALYFPFPPQRPLEIKIVEWLKGTTVVRTLFRGRVAKAKTDGLRLWARCETRLANLAREVPRFRLQRTCNHAFGDAPCGVDVGALEQTVEVEAVSGRQVTAEGFPDEADGHYALGHAIWVDGDGFPHYRTITADARVSGSRHTLTLSSGFPAAMEAGAMLKVYPGCDLRAATCEAKYDNFARFGGHPFTPKYNLVLKAMPLKREEPRGGGK
jgi:uncharacterized phage protein (TIGR02218 family)